MKKSINITEKGLWLIDFANLPWQLYLNLAILLSASEVEDDEAEYQYYRYRALVCPHRPHSEQDITHRYSRVHLGLATFSPPGIGCSADASYVFIPAPTNVQQTLRKDLGLEHTRHQLQPQILRRVDLMPTSYISFPTLQFSSATI